MAAQRKGIGYIRVSSVAGRDKANGGESFLSPELQREKITRLAEGAGVKIVAWFEDLNQSGRKKDRPQWQAALAAIEAGDAEVLLVARMSRFARSVRDMTEAVDRIVKAGGSLIAGDALQVDGPMGNLVRVIIGAVAEFEVELIAEQFAEAKAKAIGRGIKIARKPPPGYLRNAERRYVIDPELGPVVTQVFERRAAGASWSELRRFWEEQTGQRLATMTISNMVQNRTYLGEIRYGDQVAPRDLWHQPLVTVEQFEAAQPKAVTAPRPARNGEGSLLAGILTCGGCGGPMTHGSVGSIGGRRYVCGRRMNAQTTCPAPQQVLASLADPIIESAFLDWAAGKAKLEGTSRAHRDLDQALAQVAAAEGEVITFASITSASANPELLASGLALREEALEQARDKVEQLRSSGRVETRRTDALEVWNDPATTLADKRKILAAVVERLEIHLPEGRRSARGVPFSDRAVVSFRD